MRSSSARETASVWRFRPNMGSARVAAIPTNSNSVPSSNWPPANCLITLNPVFTDQVGDNATTDGLGFEYGWRAEYDFAKHWGVGVEMFGEIEDLANAGSFNDQNHSLGPTLFYNPGGDDDEARARARRRAAMTTTRPPRLRRWNSR